MRLPKLRELAPLFSILPEYTDAAGRTVEATRDALAAAIRLRLPQNVALEDTPAWRERQQWERALEPVLVVWGRGHVQFELRVPRALAESRIEWHLAFEFEGSREGRVELADLPVAAEHDDYVAKLITIEGAVPHGYHSLHVTLGGKPWEALIIAAPHEAHAPEGKSWGVFAPLYAAHSRRSWGAGDLGDMMQYLEWVNHHGGGVVATLPMLAAFDDEPSPYSPVSRLFWNELYLDVPRLPEYDPQDADLGAIAHLQQQREVDYRGVLAAKRRVLERCAARWQPAEAQENAEMRDYAEFRARIENRDSTHYHLYVQQRLAEQMRAVAKASRRSGLGLYLDFPLGVNPAGYDAWRYAHVFAKGVAVGAPPDSFFTKGQNWGFPPFDPDALREDRYAYFRACIRNHVSHAGVLRIDHVMGLHRLYWIPKGNDAKDGVYVRYREEELYAILTLESHRHQCVIVGEDLGTVPPEVPRMMNAHGLRRMYVAQYEMKPQQPPLGMPPRASVASVNTHDMPTFAAFWNGHDIDDRVKQGLLDERGAAQERDTRATMRRELTEFLDGDARVLESLLVWLAESDAELVLVNLEDLWAETEPQNVPGVPERSWRHKFRLGLEESRDDAEVRRVLSRLESRRGALLASSATHQ
ncbi:MAG TPA: 4-alpha-glucanotransferase [Thermoanaerobaculia bacterium]|nr:4-alpha-glucanotransferase [Thermoanaerobaculia bacterium]